MVFKPQTFHERSPQMEIDNPTEADLEARVAESIARAASLDATGIRVVVHGSVAVLTGTVSDIRERETAEAAASVEGITEIDNQIVVA